MTAVAPFQEKPKVRAMHVVRTLNAYYTRYYAIKGFGGGSGRYH